MQQRALTQNNDSKATAHRISRPFQIRLSRLMALIAIVAVLFSAWMFNRDHATTQRAWTMFQLRGLSDSDATRRREAAENLHSVDLDDLARTARALAGALDDPDWQVRHAAAHSLPTAIARLDVFTNGDLTAIIELAVRALIPLCDDTRDEVRFEAIQALGMLYDTTRPPRSPRSAPIANTATGAQARRAAQTLSKALQDKSPKMRAQAIWSFARAGRIGGAAVGPVKEMFENDPDRQVRVAAVNALAVGWPEDPLLYPLLLRKLKVVSDQEEHANIGWALARLAPPPPESLPDLLDALSADDWVLRGSIPIALGKLGAAGRPALPALTRLARTEFAGHGGPCPAIEAIRSIAPNSAEAQAFIAPLVTLLRDSPSEQQRQWATFLLSGFGPSAAMAVAPLRDALKSTNPDVRCRASFVLRSIGPAATSAIPDLDNLAREDPELNVQQSAAYASRKIRASAPMNALSEP
jgi:HEAT repeat protein